MPIANNEGKNGEDLFKEEKFADDPDLENSDDEEPYDILPGNRKLVTHPYDFIIRSLDDQIKDQTLILADKYQRRRVWTDVQCSRFIESLIINVPIPTCYFAELESGQYSVIDGQQRLTAIHRFLDNEYYLRALKVRPELNGKRYHQLNPEIQRLIKSRTLRCIVILSESHPDIRFDVFERLNTNSVKLSTQELRNCIYRGPLNDIIIKLSENTDFKYVRNAKDQDLRMRDTELILRFFAFHERLPQYKGSLKRFLDDYQKDGMKMETSDIEKLKLLFLNVIDDVKFVFSNEAFRTYDNKNQAWNKKANRAVYDSVMICFAKAESDELRKKKDAILNGFKALSNTQEYLESVDLWTKTREKVKFRIVSFRDMMIENEIEVGEIQFWDGI